MGRERPRRGGGEPAPRHGFSTPPSVSPRPAQPTVPPLSLSPLYLHPPPPPPQQTLPPPPPPGRGRGPSVPQILPALRRKRGENRVESLIPTPLRPWISAADTTPSRARNRFSRPAPRARTALPSAVLPLLPAPRVAARSLRSRWRAAQGPRDPPAGRAGARIRAGHPERWRASGRVFLFDRFKNFNLSFPRPAPSPRPRPIAPRLLPFPAACLAFLPPRLGSLPLPLPSSAVSSVLSLPLPAPPPPPLRPRCLQTPGSSMRSSRAECWAAASRARSPRWS